MKEQVNRQGHETAGPADVSDSKSTRRKKEVLYTWEYADGSYGSAMYNREKEKFYDCRCHEDKAEFKAYRERVRKDAERGRRPPVKSEREKIKIPSGLKWYTKDVRTDFDLTQAQDGFAELRKLVRAYSEQDQESEKAFFTIFVSILSGYIAKGLRDVLEEKSFMGDRAPILEIRPDKHAQGTDFEEIARIVQALVVDVSGKNELRPRYRRVLPPKRALNTLVECASLQLKGKDYAFPAQYCESSVLVYCRFFKPVDIKRFIERNRWATLLLYGNREVEYGAVFTRCERKPLYASNWDWECDKVHQLMKMYVSYLARYRKKENRKDFCEMLETAQDEALQKIYLHDCSGDRVMRGSAKELAVLHLVAVQIFLSFCQSQGIIDQDEALELDREWSNALYVNAVVDPTQSTCDPAEAVPRRFGEKDRGAKKDPARHENDFRDVLCKVLAAKYADNFVYVPEGVDCNVRDPGANTGVHWGFLSWYAPKKVKKHEFRALKIRRDQFEDLCERFSPRLGYGVLFNSLAALEDKGCLPGYVHTATSIRLRYSGKSKSVEGLVINVDKLDFLPEESRAWIDEKFPIEAD